MAAVRAGQVRAQGWLALLLALVGGFVDAAGYLLLFKMFIAHMSGNSIAMTVYFGEGNWREAFHRAFPIPLFVAGVAAGAALSECLARRRFRSTFAANLGVEALLLVLFIVLGAGTFRDGALRPASDAAFYFLAALPALAMGVQNSAMRRVGGIGVRTTYITGMLTNFAEEAVQYAFWFGDRAGGRRPRALGMLLSLSPRQASFKRMWLFLGIWTAYIAGGVAGAVAELRWRLPCLLAPVFVLCCVAVRDLIRPIAPLRPPRRKAEWKP